jgi:ferric-dicitrate binding protein FerR (iron transport regulator)
MRTPNPEHARSTNEPDDEALGELLKEVGRRDLPPADFTRDLKATLHAEWRAGVDRRQAARRRWAWGGAVAATLAAVAIGVGVRSTDTAAIETGRIARVAGPLTIVTHDARTLSAAVDQSITVGERLQTHAASRAAVQLANGVTLRLDHDTDLRFDAGNRITLAQGALYVDAGAEGQAGRALVVDTSHGSVRHLGTLYEVRVGDETLRVSVREGKVEVARDDAAIVGVAGERLLITRSGNLERVTIAANADDWDWLESVAPQFAIDGKPLVEFLSWAGRELGQEVVFTTPATEAEARAVVLKGSTTGLNPAQALDAVLATTTLKADRSADGRILISMRR